jgi:hypothetical protein
LQEIFPSKIRTSANFLGEVFLRTKTEQKIRNEIERKMQDIQPIKKKNGFPCGDSKLCGLWNYYKIKIDSETSHEKLTIHAK